MAKEQSDWKSPSFDVHMQQYTSDAYTFSLFFFVTTIYRDIQLLKEKKAQVKHIFTPPK